MTIPTPLAINETIIDRLFSQMPTGFSKNPVPIDTIAFSIIVPESNISEISVSTTTAVVKDGVFFVHSTSSYVDNEELDLSLFTMYSLVTYFNKKYEENGFGIFCVLNSTLPDMYKEKPALCLMEGSINLSGSLQYWPQFTSNNYLLLASIAVILRSHKNNMISALKQTDLHLAEKEWLDYWGNVIGVPRVTAEFNSDEFYRKRIQREAIYPKSNNWAIASMLRWATGLTATVTDGGQPFILGPDPGFSLELSGIEHIQNKGKSSSPSFLAIGSTASLSNTGNSQPFQKTDPTNTYTYANIVSNYQGYLVGKISAIEVYDLGPNTGSGGFIVQIQGGDNPDGTISQPLLAYIHYMVNKYKPAGMPFIVKGA